MERLEIPQNILGKQFELQPKKEIEMNNMELQEISKRIGVSVEEIRRSLSILSKPLEELNSHQDFDDAFREVARDSEEWETISEKHRDFCAKIAKKTNKLAEVCTALHEVDHSSKEYEIVFNCLMKILRDRASKAQTIQQVAEIYKPLPSWKEYAGSSHGVGETHLPLYNRLREIVSKTLDDIPDTLEGLETCNNMFGQEIPEDIPDDARRMISGTINSRANAISITIANSLYTKAEITSALKLKLNTCGKSILHKKLLTLELTDVNEAKTLGELQELLPNLNETESRNVAIRNMCELAK